MTPCAHADMIILYILLGRMTFSMAYDNIAFHKPAYQRYQYLGGLENLTRASHAVDGLKSNMSVWGGQCVISKNKKQEALWWVDLENILSIHHIIIYYRTENAVWGPGNGLASRFLGFSLYVSNTTDKSDGRMCFQDTNFTNSTIPAVINITCPVHGQYVIYYNERLPGVTYPDGYSEYAYNELCEVEVFGCSEPCYYGFDCSIPCPDPHCRYCHMETGTCQGCEPGYEGHHCESECTFGKYGYGCEKKCGHCKDVKQCHHANGTCFGGCEQGYIGDDCKFCGNKKYGEGCSIPCGHCLKQDNCYSDTGACQSGCEPGYHGDLCKSYNLAYDKSTYQRYPYRGLSENLTQSSNAVDGLKSNLSVWGGQCVTSQGAVYNATWWVNLTSIFNIHHITIYYRTENKPWGTSNGFPSRFLGFSLYISNTTSKSEGTLCFKDTNFTMDSIPAVINITCPAHGQYVIYYNERLPGVAYPDEYSQYAYNELCEVEVVGCSEPGYYGFDCSIPCPDPHCRYCHMETGTCQGCEPGYEGHHCESECTFGKYGYGCEKKCGHCKDVKQCHHANGTCFGGCEQEYTGHDCKFCGNRKYGEGCSIPCGHCLKQDNCYSDTGACQSGCDPSYNGDLCKSYNLAYDKPTYQQYPYRGLSDNLTQSSNAVDGLKSNLSVWGGQCVASQGAVYNATWWVNLTSIFNIHHITIYYRTENKPWGISNGFPSRFLGFSLYISNTTNKSEGTLCFKDTNFTMDSIPAVFNITCPAHGQYVIYYNERLPGVAYPDEYSQYAYNELCEVEVFGCSEPGYYGFDCSIPCPDPHCRYCHMETGTCQVCEPGYEGHHCESECTFGKYGYGCEKKCGHCKLLKQCHRANGTCFGGCEQGYIGDDCKFCGNKKYGEGCSIPCGHCLKQDNCYSDTGACQSGCEPGYHGDLCKSYNLAYDKPTYQQYPYKGLSENLTQSSNAVDGLKSNLSVWGGQCVISEIEVYNATWWVNLTSIFNIHHITIYYRTGNKPWGTSNGFASRFLGFSLYISNTTNKSEGTLCFKDTNFTMDSIPAVINITCPANGQYIIYYNERLPGVAYPDEYSQYAYNELCEVEVFGCSEPGYYGFDCSIPCPDPHCRYCQMETGTCQVCEPGYEGHHCESECTLGKYGYGCEKKCGHCKDVKQCHRANGTCFGGCEQGYIGDNCKFCGNKKYGEGCRIPCGHCLKQDNCYSDTGACQSGCEPGYHGDLCKSYNLAYDKPTYQQYPYKGVSENLTQSSNAVDGLKSNLSVWGGQCVISEIEVYNATWWVNLTSIFNIHHITIYYRTGNKPWGTSNGFASRFLGFSLYISNTTNKSEGTLCFKDTNFTMDSIPAVFYITCPAYGQYIIYYNERLPGVAYPDEYSQYAYNELCEVEVFGCDPGYDEPFCSEATTSYLPKNSEDSTSFNNCDWNVGTNVTIAILSILLALTVGVIIYLQRRSLAAFFHNGRRMENIQNKGQSYIPTDPKSYDNVVILDDEHQYINLDSKKEVSQYQNVS